MGNSTRRNFLRKAPTLASLPAAGAAAKGYRRTSFTPVSRPRKISDNLFAFEDTATVYVVRDGANCVLIDFGSGKILDDLRDLGITKVDWILHTHHHRDQCQGDWKAVERGIPIAVPAHERYLFADAENFWRNRRVFHLYYVRNDFNTITENIRVSRSLADYSTLQWGKTGFAILPTPGHTLGSVSLLATVDGKRVAFTGDLIHSPGKIVNLHDTQVTYGGAEGIDLGIYSLARLREQKPELLLPSHGEPMTEAGPAIDATIRRLTEYFKFQTGRNPVEESRGYAASPHLVAHYDTTSSFYAIVSNGGKAMFIDYGSASGVHFSSFLNATAATDRIRFVEHNIDALKRDFGVTSVDVAMPSHMHDDHLNGFPHLMRQHGTRIWCYENMVDVFEHPRGYNLGCVLGEPFKVSRSFRHGEKFRWEEYEFEVTHSPGHTEYQMALFVTIDGNRVAFTGDAFFPTQADGAMRHNLIFRNWVENDSHVKSVRNLIDHEPTLIAPGHGKPFAVDRRTMEVTFDKLKRQQRLFFDLQPEGETDFGMNPSWVSLYPYQILVAPGERQTIEVRVKNYYPSPMKIEVALVGPAEWRVTPDVLKFEVSAGATVRHPVTVSVPEGWTAPGPRFAIAADVMRNGKYLGQITEAVAEVRG